MRKDVVIAGLAGGIVIFIWMIISNGILPFKRSVVMKTFPNQKPVHDILKERITEPGIYSCPYMHEYEEEMSFFPDYGNEPIFAIVYNGETHNTVEGLLSMRILTILLVPLIAAWLLSVSSDRIISKFSRRFLFVLALGILLALFGYMTADFQPAAYTLFKLVNTVISWSLTGLVIAWRIKPDKT
ncbi:hypothetical protein ACFL6G_08250 [candidate division KSB1 bacterium]